MRIAATNAVTAVGRLYEVDKGRITGAGRAYRSAFVVKLASFVGRNQVDVGIKLARYLNVIVGFNVV